MNGANDPDRETLVSDARELFQKRYGVSHNTASAGGACLHWALATIDAAEASGVHLVLQAGTAMFRRLSPHLDDGKPDTLTHFSYVFDEATVKWTSGPRQRPILPVRPSPRDGVARMCLPEMHVWCGDVERQEVVDLTTSYLRAECENILKQPWLEVDPPDYVWGSTRAIEEKHGFVYQPDRNATILAAMLAAQSGR